MKINSIIAKNYAKALFKLAKSSNNVDKIAQDLDIFAKSFTKECALELNNPAISKKDSVKIIQEICQKIKIKDIVADFLSVIAQNKRLGVFNEINKEFINLSKIDSNILEIEVISASELESSEVKKLEEIISQKYKDKKIEITKTIKKNILGGIQVKIGSNLIDASLKNQLFKLEKELVEAIN